MLHSLSRSINLSSLAPFKLHMQYGQTLWRHDMHFGHFKYFSCNFMQLNLHTYVIWYETCSMTGIMMFKLNWNTIFFFVLLILFFFIRRNTCICTCNTYTCTLLLIISISTVRSFLSDVKPTRYKRFNYARTPVTAHLRARGTPRD